MTKTQKVRKRLPITGPAACWRSVDIKLACVKCGGKTSPMLQPGPSAFPRVWRGVLAPTRVVTAWAWVAASTCQDHR